MKNSHNCRDKLAEKQHTHSIELWNLQTKVHMQEYNHTKTRIYFLHFFLSFREKKVRKKEEEKRVGKSMLKRVPGFGAVNGKCAPISHPY